MISYIIIEDDKRTVNLISTIVKEHYPSLYYAGNSGSIKDGIKQIKVKNPDFIFLDVNLEDGKSFEILKEFPNPDFRIIFITSYSNYAVEAFKFSALDFILKPFDQSDIVEAIDKIKKETDKNNYISKIETLNYNLSSSVGKKLVLKNLEDVYIVNIKDIIYIRSDNNYSIFYLISNNQIIVSKTLKQFEEQLKDQFFYRVHQSYLVNADFVKSFNKKNNVVQLSNGNSIPVSIHKKSNFIGFLDHYSQNSN